MQLTLISFAGQWWIYHYYKMLFHLPFLKHFSIMSNLFIFIYLQVQPLPSPPTSSDKSTAQDPDDPGLCRKEWMLVALVMDRVFLLSFLLVTTIITLVILLDHP